MGFLWRVCSDTKGPEIRVGQVVGGQVELKKKDRITLVKKEAKEANEIPVMPASVIGDLEEGMDVLFDDGYT